jgi:DNA replicative helicase MCM subunit Mcm2 (Cdc46/Mcm family)
MSRIQDDFNAIIAKIEERITDEDELNFIKQQIADISMLYITEINRLNEKFEERLNLLAEKQKILEEKQERLDKVVDNMEKELFVEDEEYDFEIVCPYCNHEFVTDIGSSIKEVECPECHNKIELDWNEEDEEACGGHCGCCGECGHDDFDDEDEDFFDDDDDM